jgi:hypothetical protein
MATDITNKSMDYLVKKLQLEFPKQDIIGAYKKHGTLDMSKESIKYILAKEGGGKYKITEKAKGGAIKKFASGGAAKRGYGKVIK